MENIPLRDHKSGGAALFAVANRRSSAPGMVPELHAVVVLDRGDGLARGAVGAAGVELDTHGFSPPARTR